MASLLVSDEVESFEEEVVEEESISGTARWKLRVKLLSWAIWCINPPVKSLADIFVKLVQRLKLRRCCRGFDLRPRGSWKLAIRYCARSLSGCRIEDIVSLLFRSLSHVKGLASKLSTDSAVTESSRSLLRKRT